MSALPAQSATIDPTDRLSAELEAVADDARQQGEPPHPTTLEQVALLSEDEQAVWVEQVRVKDRWSALTTGPAPHRDSQWRDDAACLGTDVDLVELKTQAEAREHALDLCARCPVLAACATEARQGAPHYAYGLWAGVVWNGHGRPARSGAVTAGRPVGSRVVTALTDEEVVAWLREAMQADPGLSATKLQAAARAQGIAYPKQLCRVADQIGARSGTGQPWRLPEHERPDEPVVEHAQHDEDAQHEQDEDAQQAQQAQPVEDAQQEHDAHKQDQQPEQELTTGRPFSGPLPGLPIDPAARTASAGLLAPHSPDEHDEQPAPAGRPQRHRGQRSQPRRPRPRRRRGHRQ